MFFSTTKKNLISQSKFSLSIKIELIHRQSVHLKTISEGIGKINKGQALDGGQLWTKYGHILPKKCIFNSRKLFFSEQGSPRHARGVVFVTKQNACGMLGDLHRAWNHLCMLKHAGIMFLQQQQKRLRHSRRSQQGFKLST